MANENWHFLLLDSCSRIRNSWVRFQSCNSSFTIDPAAAPPELADAFGVAHSTGWKRKSNCLCVSAGQSTSNSWSLPDEAGVPAGASPGAPCGVPPDHPHPSPAVRFLPSQSARLSAGKGSTLEHFHKLPASPTASPSSPRPARAFPDTAVAEGHSGKRPPPVTPAQHVIDRAGILHSQRAQHDGRRVSATQWNWLLIRHPAWICKEVVSQGSMAP